MHERCPRWPTGPRRAPGRTRRHALVPARGARVLRVPCAPPGPRRLALPLVLSACALAACGKAAGPGHALARVAERGGVSVVRGNPSRIGGGDPATDAAAV